MRTLIAVQGVFTDSDGNPASGTLCITPFQPASNNYEQFSTQPICGLFDDTTGQLTAQSGAALNVFASDDESTDPEVYYTFALKVDGEMLYTFNAPLPAASTANDSATATTEGSPVVTLYDLIASIAMMGQTIVGANWPGGTTVVGYDDNDNTLTLSANATVTGTCSSVVGGAANFTDLVENQV